MIVIDCHDHIYHKKLAAMAVKGVGEYYNTEMSCGGTAEELAEITEDSPVRHFVVNAVAPNARSVKRLNDFIAGECKKHSQFTGLGTLHPDMDDAENEIERIISLGLKGIKLHPDTQDFEMDSPDAMKLYEMIEGRLPVLMHCGDYRSDKSHPHRLEKILKAFPGLTVVAAHLGGWSIFDEAVPYMEKLDCPMDISSTMPFIGIERTAELIRRYGADRILFGSDYPMWHPVREYEAFMSIEMSDEDREKILWRNTAEVFGIEIQ